MSTALNELTTPGTCNAQTSQLDWCQVRETVRMLDLAVAQIQISMTDGDESVGTLTESFTAMMGSVEVAGRAARELRDTGETEAVKHTVLENCEQVLGQMQNAIVAFQFYDKLTQRLSHVRESLDGLSDLVSDSARLFSPQEWECLQEKIRSNYSMEDEKRMFDALMGGATVEEALTELRRDGAQDAGEDEIELF